MLIIIEGPDGAGKSTLATALRQQLILEGAAPDDVTMLKKGPPTADGFTEYLVPLASYLPGSGKHVICDRWHIGELVYPTIFGRQPVLDEAQFGYIDKFLKSRGAVLVPVNARTDTLLERVRARGSGETIHEVTAGQKMLNAAVLESHLPGRFETVRTDLDTPLADQVDTILAAAALNEALYSNLAGFPVYVGSGLPSLLILGDVRGVSRTDIPTAFAPLPSSSGAYLHRALAASGTGLLEAIGFANVHECAFVSLWEELGQPPTVVLGNLAARTTQQHGVSAVTSQWGFAPHPQFIRRFHHRAHAEYGAVLRRAALDREDLRSWRPHVHPD